MKDIRKGNDINVRWGIYAEGAPFSLEGKEISLYLRTPYGKKEVTPVVEGNAVLWTFLGKDQKHTGKHSLELVINEDAEGMVTTDACDFVNLVSCSCKVGGADEQGVQTETISLTSNLEYVASGAYDDTAVWEYIDKLEKNKADKTEIPTKVSQLENDADYATKNEIDSKQDEIKDLDAIRSGAAKGATALQSIPAEYVTDDELDNALKNKVNVNQIATINGKSLVNGGNIVISGGEGGGYDDTEIRAELDELSAKVNEQTQVDAEFSDFDKVHTSFSNSTIIWEQGAIISGEEVSEGNPYYDNRIRTKDMFRCPGKTIECSIATGYGYRAQFYDKDGVWINQIVVDTGETKVVGFNSAYYVRFVILKKDNSNITPDDGLLANLRVVGLWGNATKYEKPSTERMMSDLETYLAPNYQWIQGNIDANGSEEVATGFHTRIKTLTYFYAKGETITFTITTGYKLRIFKYDSTKTFISYIGEFTNGDFYATEAGHYYRFVLLKSNGENIDVTDGNKCSISGFELDAESSITKYKKPLYLGASATRNQLQGAKVAFLGDSITYGAGASSQQKTYHGVFCRKYDAVDLTTQIFEERGGSASDLLGMNGTCIAANTKNNTNDRRFVTRVKEENLAGCNLVVVFGGTNDLSYDIKPIGSSFVEEDIEPYGNMGGKKLAAPADTETFAGALHELIKKIQDVCPKTPIIFMTPLKRNHNSEQNPDYLTCNSNGDYMIDFVNAIKEICAFYSIPVLDLYGMSQLNPLAPGWSELFPDGLHPNDTGHALIGEMLFRFTENNVII